MFRHIYFYRLKVGLHDREMVFWTFLFPLVLATLFSMAFANLSSGDVFTSIPVAVVDNQAWQQDEGLQSALFSVSQLSSAGAEKSLFDLKIMSVSEADQALKDDTIAGYLLAGETLTVVVDRSGFPQTILKIFTDEYLRVKSAVTRIAGLDPSAMASLPDRLEKRLSLVTEKPASTANPDTTLSYFYALIAMTCLYGAFWGIKEVKQIQANQSAEAARVSLAPVHKKDMFLSSLMAALTLHYLSILLLIAYLRFVLTIDFGGEIGLVLLGALAGSLLGVALGLLIGCLTHHSEGVKNAMVIGSPWSVLSWPDSWSST